MIADNYFELYINGRLIGVDATPFTPFNSHVVRFRVKRPYTIAVLAQDWEDKLGPRHGGVRRQRLAFRRCRFRRAVLGRHRDEQHVEGAVVLHRAARASRRRRRIRQYPRHLASRAHPSARQAADLPRALLRGALSDPGRLDRAELRRLATGRRRSNISTRTSASSGCRRTGASPRRSAAAAGSGRSIWCSTTRSCCARRCGRFR